MRKPKGKVKKQGRSLNTIPNTVQERREFLKEKLSVYNNKFIYCKALNAKIEITTNSIKETAHNACVSKESTLAALHIKKILKEAKLIGIDKPQSNVQIKKFKFVNVYILEEYFLPIGIVKAIVGIRINNNYLEYSITIKE